MQLEDQVLRQVGFVAPDNPADSSIYETILVSGGIDRLDAGQLEVPTRFVSI